MALNGTTWYLNETINVSTSLNITINFRSNNTNYTRFNISSSSLRYYSNTWSSVYAYRNNAWQNQNYRLITFNGNNAQLETWLNSNAIRIYNYSNSVDGNGQAIIDRDSSTSNLLHLSAIADTGNRFVKHTINGVDYTTPTMDYEMDSDTTIITYFEGVQYFNINVKSNIEGLTPYQSAFEVEEGTSVNIRAREMVGFKFAGWSDGNTELERTITVNTNIELTANYQNEIINETYYQYRGFIKDQLDMNNKPKAWVLVKTDKDKEDLLTKATSTINVQEMPTNANEGDVLVLYTPKGEIYYEGVINKISNTQIQCSQKQAFLKGTFNKSFINTLTNVPYLENQIKAVIEHFISGVYYGTDYTDTLVNTRLNGFIIESIPSQLVSLPKDVDDNGNAKNTSYDMEQFIYDVYKEYGVIVDIEFNVEGSNYITIFTPTYTQLTIGNNQNAITNLSPITTIEQTNKLIIFNSNGTYRTTYVARKDGEIVEEPVSTANRFEVVNTKIVKSDEDDETLVSANLSSNPYNHRVTFSLLTENNLYKWQDLKLGMPLHIFIDGSYFDSVLTAREIIHNENQNIKQINYTAGLVRIAITDILNQRFGKEGG